MSRVTCEETTRHDLYEIIREVLSDGYRTLTARNIVFREGFDENTAEIDCDFLDGSSLVSLEKQLGYGVVDALFKGLVLRYSEEYSSLRDIAFNGFEVHPELKNLKSSGSDANVEVVIEFYNSSKKIMSFRNRSRSVIAASVKGVFEAIEFYINSEMAFKKLKFLIEDADTRGRSDLKSRYIYKISKIVSVTSYERVDYA